MPENRIAHYSLLTVIVNKGKGERVAEAFAGEGAALTQLALARGTADKKTLAYLGLGETEKDILFAAMPHSLAAKLLAIMNQQLQFSKPGHGIAFCIAINGYADEKTHRRLKGIQYVEEDFTMQQAHYDLIMAITNQGYADEVMEVAKAAGATGGTVLHARGVGLKEAEKFFGITISPEKDVLLILTASATTRAIFDAIAEQKGCHTDARTLSFSLPVNGVAGLTEHLPLPEETEA